jgi:hypothetical protein
MNDIQIETKELPSDIRNWVDYEIAASNAHDIGVKLLRKKHIRMDGIRCSGYFSDSEPELVVACFMELNKWVPILVHESCHRDQFTEGSPIWDQKVKINGVLHDPLMLLNEWLAHETELGPRKLKEVLRASAALELDCEMRSAQKIEDYYLPINSKEYIQKANAYVYFYLVMEHTRAWYPKGKAPFYLADVWTKMPTDFDNDYTQLPAKLKKLILERCFNAV